MTKTSPTELVGTHKLPRGEGGIGGLRVKLIAPFVLGTLILTISLAVYTYYSARQAVESAMLLVSEAKTNDAVGSMSLLFKSLSMSLENMVADPHVTDMFLAQNNGKPDASLKENTTHWLEIITQGNDFFRDIMIVDKDGVCIASSNSSYVGSAFGDKPYVREALDGRFIFSEPSVGRVTLNFSLTGAGPVDSEDGVAGALIIINDFPKIVDYGSQTDSQKIFTALLNPKGEFMAHKDLKMLGNTAQVFPDLYRTLVAVGGRGGAVEYDLGGMRYAGYAKLENTSQWVVITSGVKSEIFASAYRQGMMVLGISFIFFCLTLLVVVRFANGILSLLLSLIQYAKDVSEGNHNLRLPPSTRGDELGVLHNSLQTLVLSLESLVMKTQEASKMKSAFLANMSHEIRTPMNAIIGMTHLALRDCHACEKPHDYLDKIQIAAKSLLGLINDILDLSKVEAGMLAMENMSFNLRDIAENNLTIHQETARNKSLTLLFEYEDGAPVHFIGDHLRIGQILNNLLSNALKFTQQGSVTVRCVQEHPGEIQDGYAVMRCSVIDTGIGITKEALEHLFLPFTQADNSITRKFGGTGLGLTISEKLVSMMNGAFTVTSELGKGSAFSFTMRLQLDDHACSGAKAEADSSLSFEKLHLYGKRILVVEDNLINQMIMQELLAPSGAEIVLAENGEEAVNVMTRQHFDLVFMDMQMPVMDGLEATRIIRKNEKAKDVPIIAVTANAMSENRAEGFAVGMNEYLTKPIEPVDLLRVLHIWLVEGKRHIS